jgi:hypothetical protein
MQKEGSEKSKKDERAESRIGKRTASREYSQG